MLPYAIIPLLRFVSSPKVMGELAMAAPLKALYWATCALIVGANTALAALQVGRLQRVCFRYISATSFKTCAYMRRTSIDAWEQ